MQTIRRYGNRKFYHLEGHRYVNLDGIAALVRAGQEVCVLAHPGGRDITAEVLGQIVARGPAPGEDARPAGLSFLLSSLIRLGRLPVEEAGRLLAAGLGLPGREEWGRLEEKVARLEALLQQLLDEGKSEVL